MNPCEAGTTSWPRRGNHVTLSLRERVALLGIAQRQSRVSRAHIRALRIPRKSLPTSMKTFGDFLHVKRYEKHLTLSQIGRPMGITHTTAKAWEMDAERPDERQMEQLAEFFWFDLHAGVGDCLPSPREMPQVSPPLSGAFPGNFTRMTVFAKCV
jgi:hypothetical protein